MEIYKILLAIGLILLLIGTVTAVNISDLKVPVGYNEETEGYYYLNTDENTHLYIGEMELNEEAFDTTDDGYYVYSIGDNLYAVEDTLMEMYGIQEMVKIDGKDYLVSIDKNKPLSNVDKELFKDDLESFNKLNNLKPIKVDSVT